LTSTNQLNTPSWHDNHNCAYKNDDKDDFVDDIHGLRLSSTEISHQSVDNGRNFRSQNDVRKLKHEAFLGSKTHTAYLLLGEAYERLSLFDSFAKLQKATVSFVMSVRPSAWNNSTPTRRIFMKFYI
jgi:hypothetical protein